MRVCADNFTLRWERPHGLLNVVMSSNLLVSCLFSALKEEFFVNASLVFLFLLVESAVCLWIVAEGLVRVSERLRRLNGDGPNIREKFLWPRQSVRLWVVSSPLHLTRCES